MTTLEKVSKRSTFPSKKQPLRIIAIGDSLIYGYGDPAGGGWVERLRRQWMSPDSSGHALYNLGIRGDRVCQVLERLEPEYRYRGEFRNQFPDLIILSVGVNDTPKVGHENGRHLTDFMTFQGQIHCLLQQARELCPVLFIGMVPIDEKKMPFLDCLYYTHQAQYRYKEATKQACFKYNIPYLDIFDLWMSRGETWRENLLMNDGLHPNELGYQALLQDILNWNPVMQLP
ncbi:lipolytic protein G-D-S-L family [Gloeothece citriformis PCC 7424]|uniref:Lipolytic protein G-D-S-L family n=1 Tax=Gloeothece citriformis (strain PCC 7424) TaxID=65393 RepID=B7KCA3_GLOC7|nr:GDSL-type esterase/lipase family protein [Gloeothece citriformis]ACK70208.1 lipolytic protein G-D-S-L family [Gloeothece citriformis PCC 7424]